MSWLLSIMLGIMLFGLIIAIISFCVWLDYEFDIPISSILITLGIIVVFTLIIHTILF